MIQIDVYSYPDSRFLGTRFAPMVMNNHDYINSQVKEIRKLWRMKKGTVYFKTINI